MKEVIGQQGEVRVVRIDALPEMKTCESERDSAGRHIISHSESGHHHVLPAGCDVLERTDNVPSGMRILYAIVSEPAALTQTAASAHDRIDLPPGIYEMRISREYDPFADQARIVAD